MTFSMLFKLQIVRYLFSGGIAALVNLTVLHVLVRFVGVHYLVASGAAFFVAFLVSFTLHKLVTYQDTRTERIPLQISLYLGLLGFNILLNLSFMWVLVGGVGISYLVAQIVVSGAIAVWSFFAYQHIVFRVHATTLPQSDIRAQYTPPELQK